MNLEINSETISSCFGFIFKDSFYYHVPYYYLINIINLNQEKF